MSEQKEQDLTTAEAAEYLSVTSRAVRKWVRAGHFPNAYQKGPSPRSGYMIPMADVVAFDKRRRSPNRD